MSLVFPRPRLQLLLGHFGEGEMMKNSVFDTFWVKKLFWWAGLPCLGWAAIYTLVTHQNPLEALWFQGALALCAPYFIVRSKELRSKHSEDFANELRGMTDTDLLNLGEKFKYTHFNEFNALMRGTYETEMKRRFGRP